MSADIDLSPGYQTEAGESIRSGVRGYLLGLVFAIALTAVSFVVAQTNLLWGPGVAMGLIVLAIAQIGVHLVFFLHMGTGPDHTNNIIALAFGMMIVFLVLTGSVWIMWHLNDNMMPMPHGMQ